MAIHDYENRESKAVEAIKATIPKSIVSRKVSKDFFADLHENQLIHPQFYSMSAVDSVGTKVILANAMEKYDTVGIDGVAMSANDMCPWGSVVFDLFTSFLGCQEKVEHKFTGQISQGVVGGLKRTDTSDLLKKIYPNIKSLNIGKGETASLQELQTSIDQESGFELVVSGFGYIEKSLTPRLNPQPGDHIIGLRSSGLHSNGYTAARHTLLDGDFEQRDQFRNEYIGRFKLNDKPFNNNRELGEILLEPTILYTRFMGRSGLECNKKGLENNLYGVNVTGNGLKNFNRAGQNVNYYINSPFQPQDIFKLIQKENSRQLRDRNTDGKLDTRKMYTKFNMGLGFAAVCSPEVTQAVLDSANKEEYNAKVIGEVRSQEQEAPTTTLVKDKEEYTFEGY